MNTGSLERDDRVKMTGKQKNKRCPKHPGMFEEFVARMNPKIGRAIFNSSQPPMKKKRPISAQKRKSDCSLGHHGISSSTLQKERFIY